jgi:uncharacterized protein (TIGR02271 family)
MPQNESAYESWLGRTVVDTSGDKIGKLADIYLDDQSGQPEWLAVTTGMFGARVSFVPIADADPAGDDVRVPYKKALVKDAPNADPDGHLEPQEEAALYRHYGRDYEAGGGGGEVATGEAATGGEASPEGRDLSRTTTDDAMTRSEEELAVGTQRREAGRARLRKYVVSEQVTTTVPVEREEVRVEREPITEGNVDRATDGPGISEDEHEVVLSEEEPVVEKRAVPKERVRLDKDTVQEQQQVGDEVRKEQITVEGDDES